MGSGFVLRCKKCGYKKELYLGVGFRFPQIYQETIESARKGKYGKIVQMFLEEHPDGVLNCDRVLLQCPDCNYLETGLDLSMYIPKQDTIPKEQGRLAVSAPFEDASYVAPWKLDNYELIRHYEHICRKCGTKMKALNEKDLEKENGPLFPRREQTEFGCPKCGEPLWNVDRKILWD